jgi:type IV pilus assembly protein PilM
MGEVNEQLVHEVQMAIDYFLQSGEAPPEVGLSAVYLTGGGSRVLGLDAALAASLELPVQVVNPFQRVEIDQKRVQMDYVLMQGHLYGVAVGLALRSMNDGHA